MPKWPANCVPPRNPKHHRAEQHSFTVASAKLYLVNLSAHLLCALRHQHCCTTYALVPLHPLVPRSRGPAAMPIEITESSCEVVRRMKHTMSLEETEEGRMKGGHAACIPLGGQLCNGRPPQNTSTSLLIYCHQLPGHADGVTSRATLAPWIVQKEVRLAPPCRHQLSAAAG